VLDQVELNVLDVTTWTTSTGHAHTTRSKELELIQPAPLLEYLRVQKDGTRKQLIGYTYATTHEDREANRAWLLSEVGMLEADARVLDREICLMTVQRLKRGRPAVFKDAFPDMAAGNRDSFVVPDFTLPVGK
jgi:hypothetical protein